jgi:hypothetical protein
MAKELSSSLSISGRFTLTNALDLSTPKDDLSYSFSDTLTTGTGLDSADRLWHDTRTLSATTAEDIDLAGVLTDGLGATVTFAKIKGLIIENTSSTSGCILNVGNGTAGISSWVGNVNDICKIGPGGILLLWNPSLAGYVVTATTADILKIENLGGSSVDYKIILIGTSA